MGLFLLGLGLARLVVLSSGQEEDATWIDRVRGRLEVSMQKRSHWQKAMTFSESRAWSSAQNSTSVQRLNLALQGERGIVAGPGRWYTKRARKSGRLRTLVVLLWQTEVESVESGMASLLSIEATAQQNALEIHALVLGQPLEFPPHATAHCDDVKDWAVTPRKYKVVQNAVSCDLGALLNRSGIPYTRVESKEEASHVLDLQRQDFDVTILVHGAGVLASSSALQALAHETAQKQLTLTSLGPAALEAAFQTRHKKIMRYATHPLNFARTQKALREANAHLLLNENEALSCGPVLAISSSEKKAILYPYDTNECKRLKAKVWTGAYAFAPDSEGRRKVVERGYFEYNEKNEHTRVSKLPMHVAFLKSPEASTLVAVTCAGVWKRTLTVVLSLEASARRMTDSFDLIFGVTPRFPDDNSAAALLEAGINVLAQPDSFGLTDLWNRIVAYALASNYKALVLANNDVLVPAGSISALVNPVLMPESPYAITSAITTHGGAAFYYFDDNIVPDDLADIARHPLSFARVQMLAPRRTSIHQPSPGCSAVQKEAMLTAFFFCLNLEWTSFFLLPDGRFWNSSRSINYGQEEEILKRTSAFYHTSPTKRKPFPSHLQSSPKYIRRPYVGHVADAYVYHFRGGTLPARLCKNGRLDCATWQRNHRADHNPAFNNDPPPLHTTLH